MALLDDDDVSVPTRAKTQLAAAESVELVTTDFVLKPYADVVATKSFDEADWATFVDDESRGPRQRPSEDDDLISYLFRRNTVTSTKRIVTSSVMVRTDVATAAPWNDDLRRFEDWDWLLRVEANSRGWTHVAEPLVGISLAAPSSLSVGGLPSDAAHAEWPLRTLRHRPREMADALCADIAVAYAKQGDLDDAWRAWVRARREGDPGWQSQTRLALSLGSSALQRVRSRVLSR